jgi:predicted AlkP superfamily phosphohydrolase/phosphomutase
VPAQLLVIGLDAAEATLIEQWAAEGLMPTFAELASRAEPVRLGNPMETLPGAIWPEIVNGVSGGKEARFFHSRKLHTGEAGFRRIEEDEVDGTRSYFAAASAAGKRVAVFDLPQAVHVEGLNGVQLVEWGVHDRSFGTVSEPPGLLGEIVERYGAYPVDDCDHAHGGEAPGYLRLLDDLVRGVELKEQLYLDQLGTESWDLFTCVFAETHCIGHQFWHYHDPNDRAHEPDADPRLKNAIQTVYRRVDEAVGKLIAAAGPDANVLVFTSHGMGLYIGGYQLVPELLNRLGYGSGSGAAAAARSKLPLGVRRMLRRVIPSFARKRLQTAAGSLPKPLESPQTRAITLVNNRCAAVRLNLAGREPFGSVQPGEEANAILEDIRNELLSLVDPTKGNERIVKHVLTADEAFGADRNPDCPDLIAAFRTDLGPLENSYSERTGHLRVLLGKDDELPRSGDHTVQSRLWTSGPAFAGTPVRRDANVLDLAPTILGLLEVRVPAHMEGRPLVEDAAVRG